MRRRVTLSDQMADSGPSSNLRDLLKIREGSERRETLTLGSILGCRETAAASRSLLDIIRDEEAAGSATVAVCRRSDAGTGSIGNRISWKYVKDFLLLRRNAAAWISSSPSPHSFSLDLLRSIPARSTGESDSQENAAARSDPAAGARSPSVIRTDLAAALAAERQRRQEEGEGQVTEVEEPVRVSLMALLEKTDTCTPATEGEVEEDEKTERGRGEYVCCVCMIRQKGAAFIPCGHTFCRWCSRELWVSRGDCPLCNASIIEVLDIF